MVESVMKEQFQKVPLIFLQRNYLEMTVFGMFIFVVIKVV